MNLSVSLEFRNMRKLRLLNVDRSVITEQDYSSMYCTLHSVMW